MKAFLLTVVIAMFPWEFGFCSSVEWRQCLDAKDQFALFVDGKQVGNYLIKNSEFRLLDVKSGDWLPGNKPLPHPLPDWVLKLGGVPGVKVTVETDVVNYGVDRSLIKGDESFTLNGKPVNIPDAMKILQEPVVPQDKDLNRLTIIGSEVDRSLVLKDLESSEEFKPFRGKYLIQGYPPDHWAVKGCFYSLGSPTIYLQSFDGKVLHRQDDYKDGIRGLVYALRKADPAYNPSQDIDRRKTLEFPGFSPYIPLALLFLCIVGLAITTPKGSAES